MVNYDVGAATGGPIGAAASTSTVLGSNLWSIIMNPEMVRTSEYMGFEANVLHEFGHVVGQAYFGDLSPGGRVFGEVIPYGFEQAVRG
jgi:hypothetical protein